MTSRILVLGLVVLFATNLNAQDSYLKKILKEGYHKYKGECHVEGEVKKGKMIGEWKYYCCPDSNNTDIIKLYKRGRIVLRKYYDCEGLIISIHEIKKDSIWKSTNYHTNGNIRNIKIRKNGRFIYEECYNKDGKICSKVHVNGKVIAYNYNNNHVECYIILPDDVYKMSGKQRNGEYIGKVKYYDKNGKLIRKEILNTN